MGNRRRRLKLWNEDPHCWYCGCLTVERPKEEKMKSGNTRPPNEATLEHLRSRLNPERKFETLGIPRTVLSCLKCNEAKGASEERLLPKEELWERSKRHPKGVT